MPDTPQTDQQRPDAAAPIQDSSTQSHNAHDQETLPPRPAERRHFALYSPCYEDPWGDDSMLLLWDHNRRQWLTYYADESCAFGRPRPGLDDRGEDLVRSAFGLDGSRDLSQVSPEELLGDKSWDDVPMAYKAKEGWGYDVTKLPPPR